jgi:hypothetical protein
MKCTPLMLTLLSVKSIPHSMKPNTRFSKMTKTAAAIGCISVGGFVTQATALSLTFDQARFLGELDRGPGSGAKEQQYVNRLAGMSLGTMFNAGGRTYTRSGNPFDPLPVADFVGRVKHANTGIVLDGTYDYLLARYSSAATMVWYVGGLTGSFDLPASYDQHNGISHYSLFRGLPSPASPPPVGVAVPDTGSSFALLGVGVASLGLFHRRVRKHEASRHGNAAMP